jgi:amino acid transporter
VGNGFNFAKFFLYTWINNPGEWLLKFLACAIVIAISFVHYRLVNIGIKANNLLAGYKVIFLSFLIITGFVSVCIKGGRGTLRGRHDFGHTQTNVDKTRAQCFTEFNWSNITEIGTTPIVKPDAATGPVNVVVAILLVFFSYSGWENASAHTSIELIKLTANALQTTLHPRSRAIQNRGKSDLRMGHCGLLESQLSSTSCLTCSW